jgi:hypothetical protein
LKRRPQRRADCTSKLEEVAESFLPCPRADSVELDPSLTKLLAGSHGQLIDATNHKAGISNARIVFTRTIVPLTL